MDKSLYKDTLNFYSKLYERAPEGNNRRRLCQHVAMIVACFLTKRCTVDALSWGNESTQNKNSLLQKCKRYLKNKWVDYETFFHPLALFILQKIARTGELIFVMDGSQIGNHTVLMVSVIWKKFALPIVWTLRKGEKGHFPEEMHVDVLNQLATLAPKDCRSVLLGDGEFDGFDLREVCLKNKWEFVLRTIKNRKIKLGDETGWASDAYPFEGEEVFMITDAVDGINLISWHNATYEQPIYLLTNMDLGAMACEYYKRRFEIENMFKRLKSQGFHIDKTRITQTDRINRLLLVTCAAYLLLSELGRFLKERCNPKDIQHVVCKDRLPKMTFLTLAWKAIKADIQLAIDFFSQISKNTEHIFT
jgi:hypothetical protein